ncbi:MAG: hypothetical protein HYV32_01965 [Candidatus Kerfeldbacteria bacterium]|nr:hypothetical protein [Candidatus Kerfeldbacteria bacterium]
MGLEIYRAAELRRTAYRDIKDGPKERNIDEQIEIHFRGGDLCSDVLGGLVPLTMVLRKERFESLRPMLSYEEYVRTSFSGYGTEYVDAVLERSNKSKILEYNRLVSDFNASIPRIVQEKDSQAVSVFETNITALFSPSMGETIH